ncbi:MAG: hypothetical protein K2L18_11115, partial [Acetatifactor sp.]|nr:hypothetical protein [Acetatifactor sp.]
IFVLNAVIANQLHIIYPSERISFHVKFFARFSKGEIRMYKKSDSGVISHISHKKFKWLETVLWRRLPL